MTPEAPTPSPSPADSEGSRDWAAYFRNAADHMRESPTFAGANELYRVATEAPDYVAGFLSVRIGILRNVTVEPWIPDLFVGLLQRGIKAEFWTGEHDVFEPYGYADGLRLPGALDYLMVHLDASATIGDARYDPPSDLEHAIVSRVEHLIVALSESTYAKIILSNFGPDPVELYAPHVHQDPGSWPNRRRAINLALTERYSSDARVVILDLDRAISAFGAERAYDARMYLTARSPFAVGFLPRLGQALATIVAADRLPPKKCVVVDCDNTLWGGVLGEDGPGALAIGEAYPGSAYRQFQLFLKGLHARGVLLAVNSKNNEADVLEFFDRSPDMILRATDLAAYRINWKDKASNVRELAAELNIGLDAMILIDDSAVECELIRSLLPEVQVERFPSDPIDIEPFCASLRNLERLSVTDDDLKRAASMRANGAREQLRLAASDLSAFIESLEIRLTITKQDRDRAERISQLTQRTNQFNLTTRRYTVQEVQRWFERGTVYSMRMRDRFSDYGMIGVAITKPTSSQHVAIDSFMLSCRAFGRGVEGAFLGVVIEDARAGGATVVRACYLPTPKNQMVRDFFPEQGFAVTEDRDSIRRFEYALGAITLSPPSEGADPYDIERIGFDRA
jgi:FkbH-like protein